MLPRVFALILIFFLITELTFCQDNDGFSRVIPSTFFGMDLIGPRVWPAVIIGSLGKGAGTGWRYLEPARGVYNWYGTDLYVEAAERHGVDVLYTFYGTPQWASARPEEPCDGGPIGCAAPPTDIHDWENFVRALATRYKGRIKVYELWNEPTTQLEWSGTYAELIKLAKSAYLIIKSIDPGALLLTPAPSAHGYQPRKVTSPVQPDWMRDYLNAGGDSFADGGSWHAYPWPNACQQMMDCAGTPLITQIEAMRSIFDHSALKNKPIYVTEGGWRTNSELRDPDQQAAYISRWYILLASRGISRAYWHAWDDDRWGTLWDPAAGLHKAGIAYEQVQRWLSGSSIGPCIDSSDVWKCDLRRADGNRGLILWRTFGTQAYSAPPAFNSYHDLDGRLLPIRGPLQIGIKPILLETSP